MKNELKNLFVEICDELATKTEEKETYFEALKRECLEYPCFPILPNLCDLLENYYDLVGKEKIIRVLKIFI